MRRTSGEHLEMRGGTQIASFCGFLYTKCTSLVRKSHPKQTDEIRRGDRVRSKFSLLVAAIDQRHLRMYPDTAC